MTAPETVVTQTTAEEVTRLSPEEVERFTNEFTTHQAQLTSYALSLTRNPDDAEDLVQEAFTRVMRTYGHATDEQESFKGLLFRTTRNHFLDKIRREKKKRMIPEDFSTELGTQDGSAAVQPLWQQVAHTPEETVISEDAARQILRRLVEAYEAGGARAELVRRNLASIVLMDDEGYPKAEAADILNIPINTLGSGKCRLLKDILADFTPELLVV